MSRRDVELERIAAIASVGPGRSPLYRWLWERHDDFAALLADNSPDWAALTEGFKSLGLTGRGGVVLIPETVRNTWWRVRKEYGAASRAQRAASSPAEPPRPARAAIPEAAAQAAPPSPPPSFRRDVELAPPPDQALANLRREINKRSGRG